MVAFVLTTVTLPALAIEVLDQQNDTNMSAIADSASPGAVETGQIITVGVTGTLHRIDLQINRSFGTGGNALLSVYPAPGGVPSMTALGSASRLWSDIPTGGFGYISFDYSSQSIPVTAGQQLALGVLGTGSTNFLLRYGLDTYAGGDSKWRVIGASTWTAYAPPHDNGFRTYVDVVAVSSPGDFNDDGHIDAADYVVWRKNLGQPTETALHGNGDNMNGVDQGDYNLWRQNFAVSGSGAGGSSQPVPEPAATILDFAGSICVLLTQFRRK
jgi:hypothetical protein